MSAIKPAAGIHLSGLGNRFLLAVQQNLIAVRSIPRSILTNGFEVQILKIPPLGSSEGCISCSSSLFHNPSPLLHHGFACFRWSWQKNPRISENEAQTNRFSSKERKDTHTQLTGWFWKQKSIVHQLIEVKPFNRTGNAQSSLLFPEFARKSV